MPKEVKYRITADDKSQLGLTKAERGLKRFSAAAGNMASSIKRMFVITFGDVVRVVQSAVRMMADSVKAYGEQQAVESNLAAAFELAGANAADSVPRIEKLARAIQLLTTEGDEATMSAAAYGMQLGVGADSIDSVTIAAVGLSRKIKKDLNTSMMLLARATQGQFDLFTRYGIALDDTATDQEKFNTVMGLAKEGFSLARAEGETMLGNVQQLKNAWGDLKQSLGSGLLQAATSTTDIDDTSEKLLTLADASDKAGIAWGAMGREMKAYAINRLTGGAAGVGVPAWLQGLLGLGAGAAADALGKDKTGVSKTSAPSRKALFESFGADMSFDENEAMAYLQRVKNGDQYWGEPPKQPGKRANLGLSQAFDIARGVDRGPNSSPEVRAILDVKTAIERQTEELKGAL